jgi:hypothetical protein
LGICGSKSVIWLEYLVGLLNRAIGAYAENADCRQIEERRERSIGTKLPACGRECSLPNCNALYQIVKIAVGPDTTACQVTCRSWPVWQDNKSGNSTVKRGEQIAKTDASNSILHRSAPKLLWRCKAADRTAPIRGVFLTAF